MDKCFHPLSCSRCDRQGQACGRHHVGDDGHELCSGEGPDETLGPCGCVDYHLADCDIRTGGSGMTSSDYMEMYSDPDYDPYYDSTDH